ncbi:MAG: DUF1015 family protein [Clostridiales Family XIII bacterium]|jgi:uncharacterized protein (DUF1015 family)|nr:DUF1015 family protein [Clostridiales Family XIII bacterium]
MATIIPFKAVRPADGESAEKIAALPYDVFTEEEVRELAAANPLSFIRVDRAEADFHEGTDPYSDEVYAAANGNYKYLLESGVLIQDEDEALYLYELTKDGRSQLGIVCCASACDYISGVIKQHELTRHGKEEDRIRHSETLGVHASPVFMFRERSAMLSSLTSVWSAGHEPIYRFVTDDGVGHKVYKIDNENVIRSIVAAFSTLGSLYIADGHHRAASAAAISQKRRSVNGKKCGEEEYDYFLTVIFPAEELRIYDFNRFITDTGFNTAEEFVDKVREKFVVRYKDEGSGGKGSFAYRPGKRHEMGLYVDGRWYCMVIKEEYLPKGGGYADSMDASLLQELLIGPVIGIEDARRDERIDFIGGVKGLGALERLVDAETVKGKTAAAFAMYPVSIEEVVKLSSAGEIMPPKSTWFEPKLLSGLFVHPF